MSGAEIGTRHLLTRSMAIDNATKAHMQLFTWAMAVALNECEGFGAQRIQRVMKAIDEVSDWVEGLAQSAVNEITGEPDYEYAREKLRERAEKVSGLKVEYINDQLRR